MGVGRAVMVKGRSGAMAVVTVFRAMVARSASRVWKLWTGRPSLVRPGGLLGDGGGRALGLGDDAGAERVCGLFVGVVVEHGRQALAHVPPDSTPSYKKVQFLLRGVEKVAAE